jgi:hypothetical protein
MDSEGFATTACGKVRSACWPALVRRRITLSDPLTERANWNSCPTPSFWSPSGLWIGSRSKFVSVMYGPTGDE